MTNNKPQTEEALKDLLTEMRCEVEYTDKATMPIPLYEKMKAILVDAHETDFANINPAHETDFATKLKHYEELAEALRDFKAVEGFDQCALHPSLAIQYAARQVQRTLKQIEES